MAALFALGPGCAYPIYEERELWGAETVAPSMLVLMGYSFVVMGGTTLGLGVTWFGLTGNLVMTTILISGLSVYLVLTVGLPVLSYWYSRRRYRRYVLEWTHSLWRGIGTRHGDFIHERLPDRLPEPPLEDGVVPECQTNHRPNAIDAGTPLRFVFTPCAPVSSWPVNAPVTKIATNRSAIQTNESIRSPHREYRFHSLRNDLLLPCSPETWTGWRKQPTAVFLSRKSPRYTTVFGHRAHGGLRGSLTAPFRLRPRLRTDDARRRSRHTSDGRSVLVARIRPHRSRFVPV